MEAPNTKRSNPRESYLFESAINRLQNQSSVHLTNFT
jgi:hypothetical protein